MSVVSFDAPILYDMRILIVAIVDNLLEKEVLELAVALTLQVPTK